MIMGPRLRKAFLAIHILVSVGWIGAVAAYLVLDVKVTFGDEAQQVRAAYIAMGEITDYVIVPLAYATVGSGLVMSLGTKWGLFRHYWVIISLVLTLVALAVLLIEARTVHALAALAADPGASDASVVAAPGTMVHSVGGTVVLLVVMVLNIYKPRGLTAYGWRKQQSDASEGRTHSLPGKPSP